MDDENEKLNELDETIDNPDDVQPTDDGDTTMPAGPEVGTDGDDDGDDGGNTDGNDDGNDDGDTTLPAGPEEGTDGDGNDDGDDGDLDTEETESGPQIRPTASDDGSGTLIKSFPLAETVNDDDDMIIETSLPQTEHIHADTLRDYFRESILDSAYPVGSIYMTVESTSPARLFGGTWERITGMFLVGAGNTFTAGSTGGSDTVTLSTNNLPAHTHSLPSHTHSLPSHTHSLPSHTHSLPSHTHSIPSLSGTAASAGAHTHSLNRHLNAGAGNDRNVPCSSSSAESTIGSAINSAGAHTHSVTTNSSTTGSTSGTSGSTSGTSGSTSGTSGSTSGTSGSTGSGSAFSILPPYLAVYMWKRTA